MHVHPRLRWRFGWDRTVGFASFSSTTRRRFFHSRELLRICAMLVRCKIYLLLFEVKKIF